MPKVGLATGIERRTLLKKAAYYIRSEAATQVTSRVVILPRPAFSGGDFCRTRPNAMMGLLDELVNFHDGEIKYLTFDEIVICGDPNEYGLIEQIQSDDRLKHLPVTMRNLYEQGPWDPVEIQTPDGNSREVRVNRAIRRSKFRISLAVPSADSAFGLYGSLQNLEYAIHPADRHLLLGVSEPAVATGREERADSSFLPDLFFGGGDARGAGSSVRERLRSFLAEERTGNLDERTLFRTLYSNVAVLAEHLLPDLAFVDGTHVVSGTGDRDKDVLDGGFAVSGDDPVAVDTVLARVLGVDVETLGHLQYLDHRGVGCARDGDIKVARGNPDDVRIDFTPHPTEERRLGWRQVKLPGENGEAVGYVAPEGEPSDEEEPDDVSTETDEAEQPAEDATDEEPTAGDESEEPTAEAEPNESDTAAETTADTTDEEAEAAPAADQDLPLRDRIRNRLIRRSKLEGEISGEGAADRSDAPAGDDTTESTERDAETETTDEGTEEVEPDTPETDDEGDGTETKQEAQPETNEPEAEPATEAAEEDEGTGAPSPSAADEELDLRDRIRRRLIRRGKLEGELPGEEPETSTGAAEDETESESPDETADDEEQGAPEPADETPPDSKPAAGDRDSTAVEGEESGAEVESSPEEDAEASTGTPPSASTEEDLSLRDRIRNRLIRRGKMEGELAGDQPAAREPAEDEGAAGETESGETQEQASSEPEAGEEVDETDEKSTPEETVSVTDAPGPALEPADDPGDPDEVLSGLSSYGTEEKIRRRLALRRGTSDGRGRADGTAGEAPGAPDEQVPDGTDELDGGTAGAESDGEGEASSSGEEEPETSRGYERDPDRDLRDRVRARLKARGKLS